MSKITQTDIEFIKKFDADCKVEQFEFKLSESKSEKMEILEGEIEGLEREIMNMKKKTFWISIKHVDKCLFSRSNGYVGKVIWKWSICVRLFGKDII